MIIGWLNISIMATIYLSAEEEAIPRSIEKAAALWHRENWRQA